MRTKYTFLDASEGAQLVMLGKAASPLLLHNKGNGFEQMHTAQRVVYTPYYFFIYIYIYI